MTITINEKEYKLKYTLRALFIYEQITGKMFELKTLTDEYVFFYCIIMANNPECTLTFDDLISAIDENPLIMKDYQEFFSKELDKQKQFKSEENPSDDKKKF